MRTEQFIGLLQKLKLKPAGKRTAEYFGISLRQLQRITNGKSPVPGPVALLAIAYSKGALPNIPWSPDVSRVDAIQVTTRRLLASIPKPSTPEIPKAVEPAQPAIDANALAANARQAKLDREQTKADRAGKRFSRGR